MNIIEAMACAHEGCGQLTAHDPGKCDYCRDHRQFMLGKMRAALSAAEAHGWVLVPKEATDEMAGEAFALSDFTLCSIPDDDKRFRKACLEETRSLYRMAVAQAPKP